MNQLKILVFEAYPFFSGSQRITLNVCNILKKEGHLVTLLLADDRYGNIKNNFEGYVEEIQYLKVYEGLLKYGDEDSWFSTRIVFKSIFFGLLPLYIRCLKLINMKNYDYLYCCDPRGATMMLMSALLFRKTAILHFHGKNRLPTFLSKIFLKIFNKTICVSQDVFDSLPISSNKVVIYNGIDFAQYQELDIVEVSKEAEFLAGSLSKEVRKFLYAGLLRPHKGVHHLIFAFKHLVKNKSLKIKPVLFLCGAAKTPSEEAFRDFLIQYCKENDLEKNIFWLGWKNNVLAWMQYADFFVFPTVQEETNNFDGFGKIIESTEGLPTVLIESSLCGLYNIAAEVTGVKEIISNGINGTVYSNNDDDSLYQSLLFANNSRRQFTGFPKSEHFSLTRFENHIISLFKNK